MLDPEGIRAGGEMAGKVVDSRLSAGGEERGAGAENKWMKCLAVGENGGLAEDAERKWWVWAAGEWGGACL